MGTGWGAMGWRAMGWGAMGWRGWVCVWTFAFIPIKSELVAASSALVNLIVVSCFRRRGSFVTGQRTTPSGLSSLVTASGVACTARARGVRVRVRIPPAACA